MAFELLQNNLSGVAVIDKPAGAVAKDDNFVSLFDYDRIESPGLKSLVHLKHGLGKITPLLRILGQENYYYSDMVQHAEEGRLHNILTDVVITGTTAVSPTPHPFIGDGNEVVLLSDGVTEIQCTVVAVTDDVTFELVNDDGSGAINIAGNVDIMADFGTSFKKGSDASEKSYNWEPDIFKNYTHIHKKSYNVSESAMRQDYWVQTKEGPRWFNWEIFRTDCLHDNEVDLLGMFHRRKSIGDARGCNGVIPTIEQYGNISNEYITNIEEMSEIARRIKQQNPSIVEVTMWYDHQQGAYIRQFMGGVNAAYADGAFYGMFNNSKEMALKLDFKTLFIDGITFHFTPWKSLDDPSLMGSLKFLQTNIAYLIVPMGTTSVTEKGETVSKPYLSVEYRSPERKKQVKLFGGSKGTPIRADRSYTDYLTEFTNRIVGANSFFVGRRGVYYN